MTRLQILLASLAISLFAACTGESQKSDGAAAGGSDPANAAPTQDIVDTAIGAGSFKTLAKALGAAGLVDTLRGKGPFTVFAPTDEAFAKIPAETLQGLLADKEKLTAVLTYHVHPGKAMAADVVGLSEVPTVQGTAAPITKDGDKVMIDGATIVKTDIECTNGVIHVIDAVIMPE